MILPDLNLLVYAHNSAAPHHQQARAWWQAALNGRTAVGLPWAVTCGFIRLVTHPRILVTPLRPAAAMARVRAWFTAPAALALDPGPRHLDLLEALLSGLGIAGALTTDAHLAALAIEHGAVLHTNDTDFARFEGLRWMNPLASRGGASPASPRPPSSCLPLERPSLP